MTDKEKTKLGLFVSFWRLGEHTQVDKTLNRDGRDERGSKVVSHHSHHSHLENEETET